MEDVLDVYTRPYDPRRPQVCLDETSVQLIGETRTPVPMAPGQPARYDFEYERHGVCALFMGSRHRDQAGRSEYRRRALRSRLSIARVRSAPGSRNPRA